MRIGLAEDLMLLRVGRERLLADEGLDVVASVDNGPSLVRVATDLCPDLAIIDVRLPPSHTDEGLRAALEISRAAPGVAILILSRYVEEQYALELLDVRTDRLGYLLKDRVGDVDEFLDTLRRVAAGATVLDPEVVTQLFGRRRAYGRLGTLTAREREVLALMAEGRTNAGIAERLVVTERTVEKHISAIFTKLDLPDTPGDHRRVLAVLPTCEPDESAPDAPQPPCRASSERLSQ